MAKLVEQVRSLLTSTSEKGRLPTGALGRPSYARYGPCFPEVTKTGHGALSTHCLLITILHYTGRSSRGGDDQSAYLRWFVSLSPAYPKVSSSGISWFLVVPLVESASNEFLDIQGMTPHRRLSAKACSS